VERFNSLGLQSNTRIITRRKKTFSKKQKSGDLSFLSHGLGLGTCVYVMSSFEEEEVLKTRVV